MHYVVRDILFVISVIESIVLQRSLLAVPNTFMSFFSLSCRKNYKRKISFSLPTLSLNVNTFISPEHVRSWRSVSRRAMVALRQLQSAFTAGVTAWRQGPCIMTV